MQDLQKPKRPRGRPKGTGKPYKNPSERVVDLKISLPPQEKEWLKSQPGGASWWVREQIRKASP